MPDRIIRDELLTSDRWVGLPDNADRLAFVALLLKADSLGNVEGGEARLYRLWEDFGVQKMEVDMKLRSLGSVDLIRLYEFEGKRYIHIPRFRQTTRYTKCLHPLSPWTTEAQKQALTKNSHGEHQVGTMCALGASTVRTECSRDDVGVGVGVGVGVEVKRSDDTLSRASAPSGPGIRKAKLNGHAAIDPGFLAFWASYPRKDGKADAAKAWAKLKPSGELATRIMTALQRSKDSVDWQRNGGQYVPFASKWINGKRWEDDLASELPADLV